MHHLVQPRVLTLATAAGLATALACYPRLALWDARPAPMWYLELAVFVCSILLWGFVFAWHTPYTRQPVFLFQFRLVPALLATLAGIGAAGLCHYFLDPSLQTKFPQEYPPDVKHWLASLPFILALTQLFLVFAAFDWCLRLFKNRWVAMGLTALFGAGVIAAKIHTLPGSFSAPLVVALVAGRLVTGCLAVWFYLRGGVLLVWWWTLLFESRHLLGYGGY